MDIEFIKAKVLDLAIKGKLVEQRADEKLSPDVQALPELQGEFEIPANWKWAAIEDISQINPKNKLTDDYDVSFVAMADISPGFDNSFQQSTAKWGKVKKGYTHFQDGDVLVAKITPCFENRKSAVARGLINRCGAGTTEVYALRPKYAHIIADYLLFFCKSERFIQQGISRFTGSVGQQRLSKDNLKRFKIPLPPLEEQLRIVTKLEEILTNISTIEKLLNNN